LISDKLNQAHLQNAGEGQLVLKKLVSTLCTYCIRSFQQWNQPLLHLATCLQQNAAIAPENLSTATDAFEQLLPSLTEPQVVVLLWLSSMLATEASKSEDAKAGSARIHEQMETMVRSAILLIKSAVTQPSTQNAAKVKGEAISCFLNWVNYAQPRWSTKTEALDSLRSLTPDMASLVANEDLRDQAADVFRDILENYSAFFQAPHMQLIASMITGHIQPILLEGLRDQAPDVIPLAQLVVAYGNAIVQTLVSDHENEHCRNILQLEFAILEAPGFPGDDDEVSVHSIEFWNTYIEYVNDEAYESNQDGTEPSWLTYSKAVCSRLIEVLLSKMCAPPPHIAQRWTSLEEEAFREFRMDASDLMLSVCQQLGSQIAQLFASTALQRIQAKDWREAETALYCLNRLSDVLMELNGADALLAQVFGSSLFRDVADFNQPVPHQARRATIDLLGSYGEYVQHHDEFLPDALRFLFASLETSEFSNAAARSIGELCSTCRKSLVGELDGFLAHYNSFASSAHSDYYANEKVIGAIASIIEALTPEAAKARPLSTLLDIIEGMIANVNILLTKGDDIGGVDLGLAILKCLASIGKGLQVPDDVAIDVDAEHAQQTGESNYWSNPEGQSIQLRILNCCYTVLRLIPSPGEIVEGFCQVLRTGFPEVKPGPFVFPPDVVVEFVEQSDIRTPQLEAVLSVISTFIAQLRARRKEPVIMTLVERIYKKLMIFIQSLNNDPGTDPSLTQSTIEALISMFDGFTSILLDHSSPTGDSLRIVLDFALLALNGTELLSKRTAAEFWSKFIKLTLPSASSEDGIVRERAGQAMAAYGPNLSRALILQITGQAMRSELDQLCAPLSALTQTQPQAKAWLQAALFDENLLAGRLSAEVDEKEKKRFLETLGRVHDARKIKEVVRSFYAACRGTVQSF
jgi:hypothetical protein